MRKRVPEDSSQLYLYKNKTELPLEMAVDLNPFGASFSTSKHEHAHLGGLFTELRKVVNGDIWLQASTNKECGVFNCLLKPDQIQATFFSLTNFKDQVSERSWAKAVTGSYLWLCSFHGGSVSLLSVAEVVGRKISPVLRMFGQSIGGIDMDGNSYPGKLFFLKDTWDKPR